ncbi:metal-dependent hydrolase [Sinomonas sp. P10A9]|uniref:Metal-dependent hydrolase n=1 Tax=Sinomonas puerhi TaxID=3238584 RepID=A0AB39L7V4_9MICC
MGPHHAACGAAAWVALTTRVHYDLTFVTALFPPEAGLGNVAFDVGWPIFEGTPTSVIVGALVTAGAALLPDADHRSATIAQSLPPVSNVVCASVGAIAGGHRNGTHSLVGIAAFVAMAWFAGRWTVETPLWGTLYVGTGLVSLLLVSFAAKVLGILPDGVKKLPWVLSLPLAAFVALNAPDQPDWFPLAVGIGAAVHIAGDLLTTGGCNLIWPLRFRRPTFMHKTPIIRTVWRRGGHLSLPILGDAGSWREWLMLVPVSLYAIIGVGTAVAELGRGGLVWASALWGIVSR